MNKFLIDLCCRLPYHLKGRLEEQSCDCELVGINVKDSTIDVLVPDFNTHWTCSVEMFKPYLKPLFPTIYEKQPDGRVPWLEYKRRRYGKLGSEFLDNLVSWEFKKSKHKWYYFEGKIRNGDKVSDISEIATFYHYLSYQVAYETGIDVEGFIKEGKALLWTP